MEETVWYIEILRDVGIPILTLIGGWFAHMFRTKQKKEADILDNMKQILTVQREYIASQDAENKKTRDMNARLERKLDDKSASIRQANKCQYTTEGDGCPVLNHEDLLDERCRDCKLNQKENADSKD